MLMAGGMRMNGFYFTFRSVTAAQRGQRLLSSAGIPSTMLRTPAVLSVHGCGHCLRVSSHWAAQAANALQGSGVQRCYMRNGDRFEEAQGDLL